MRYSLLAIALVFGVSGCSQDNSNSGPPDLTPKDLVGCWQYSSDSCLVQCFDWAGGYLAEVGRTGTFDANEDSGTYVLNHFTETDFDSTIVPGGNHPPRSTLKNYYRRDSNALVALNSDGTATSIFWRSVAPDSFSCGIKPWRFFQKPTGWDSLVKPMQ